MVRRILNVVMTLGVIGVVVIIAARVAEPSVRPILYPASVSPATTVVPAPAEASAVAAPATTTTTTAAPSTTTTAPVATTTVAATTTTTVAPVDEVAVLTAPYAWGPSVDAVLLQEVLGVSADGWYGPATRTAHIVENQSRGLPLDGIPPVPTTTVAPPTTTVAPPTTTGPPIMVNPTFGGMGAELVAQLLGQPCIADGDLSDCPPEVGLLVTGLVGG